MPGIHGGYGFSYSTFIIGYSDKLAHWYALLEV
jgi:hypothetical protein